MELIIFIMTITRFCRILCVPVLFSIVFISCKKETKQEERKAGIVPPTTNPAFMNLDQRATAPANTAPVQAQAPNQAVTNTAPGMNPPHGQPGHRCDIAVGAPLNSPAGHPKAQMQQPAQAMQPIQQQPAPAPVAQTAPGMNPPHGQPGHRCDVAVGAPLP